MGQLLRLNERDDSQDRIHSDQREECVEWVDDGPDALSWGRRFVWSFIIAATIDIVFVLFVG
jgi:hypothetical protein